VDSSSYIYLQRRGRLHKRQIESAAEGVDLKDGEVNNLKRQKVDNEEDNLQYHHAETDWYIENGMLYLEHNIL